MNIRFPLYDLFGYLLPGVIALLALLLVIWSIYLPAAPLAFAALPKQVWFLLLVLAYFAGHLVQAVGNVFSDLVEHPEERVFGDRADASCKALVKEAHSLIYGSLGITNIAPIWIYRVCDAVVLQCGTTNEREIFVYREGFYRGASVSFGILTLALLVRALTGNAFLMWNGIQFGVPRSLLFGLVSLAAVSCALMIFRFHRFAQHRVKHALIGFLLIRKFKRAEVNNA
jgi:hypothetical protein